MFQFFLFQFVPSDLQHQHVSKEEEEDLTDQQVCKQDKNSSLDLDDSESPQIKEEKEEPCTSQEREQLGLKQESDNFVVTHEESDHSEPEAHSDRKLSCNSPGPESQCNTDTSKKSVKCEIQTN